MSSFALCSRTVPSADCAALQSDFVRCPCVSSRPHTSAQSRARTMTCSLPDVDHALLCTSITGDSMQEALKAVERGNASGADVLELRLDLYKDFSSTEDLEALIGACHLPYIVTYRPLWEGGNYEGEEGPRFEILWKAVQMGAPAIDIELEACDDFLAGQAVPDSTTLIMSNHNFTFTPSIQELQEKEQEMRAKGAKVAKLATTANDVTDAWTMINLLQQRTGPLIALSMGERGVITRILATKYGGYLTFAAMSTGEQSAPGQPSLHDMLNMYASQKQTESTKVYGIIGNPVSHSRSPVLHNSSMQETGFDGVYVPLLVDHMQKFLSVFTSADWAGFSVTIPHKEDACRHSDADPVAASIGAVNTLVRRPDGSLAGYNTDWDAAISAVEDSLSADADGDKSRPLQGLTAVVLGTGGAARALAFGAAARGANVIVAGRRLARATDLAYVVTESCPEGTSATACAVEAVQKGELDSMHVLMNTTPLGMVGEREDQTPVPVEVLEKFKPLVFDAVYTPLDTRLLKEAQACGCKTVNGLEMFVGQAAKQFEYFTGKEPPVDTMRSVVLTSLQKS